VRADPPAEIIHTTTTTGTTTINPAKGPASRELHDYPWPSRILQHDDHRWPRPGDVVECEIEGMGMIWNIFV
jgi:hypothetical protein